MKEVKGLPIFWNFIYFCMILVNLGTGIWTESKWSYFLAFGMAVSTIFMVADQIIRAVHSAKNEILKAIAVQNSQATIPEEKDG
ncbi:MAG: hypothetical protein WCT18_01950 [Patescibacteria group bacterium]